MFSHNLRSVALTLVMLAATATVAHAAVTPDPGISGKFNAPMCDTNGYERVQTPATEYAVSDSVATCVASQKYHADFAVNSVQRNVGWQYPNLAAGYTPEGDATCANPERDTCYQFPVPWAKDGTPVQSFGSWLAPGTYNLSDDIWFAPYSWEHSSTDAVRYHNNVELMVWFAHPGIDDTSHFVAYAVIDHLRWGIMSWISGKGRYIAYVALSGPGVHLRRGGTRVAFAGIWLNQFFRNAEYHRWLPASYYLWTVDAGFELVRGGKHNNIHDYALSGLPDSR